MGHLEEVERLALIAQGGARAYKRQLHARDCAIAAARADGVSPKALSARTGLSPQQIRRICKEIRQSQ